MWGFMVLVMYTKNLPLINLSLRGNSLVKSRAARTWSSPFYANLFWWSQIFFVSTCNACYSVINDRTAACTTPELLDLEYLLGHGGR